MLAVIDFMADTLKNISPFYAAKILFFIVAQNPPILLIKIFSLIIVNVNAFFWKLSKLSI